MRENAEVLYNQFHRMNRQLHRLRAQQKRKVHPGQARTLSLMLENEGASQSELAGILDIRPSSMTNILTRLEKQGFIERKKDNEDMRITRIYLTDEGKEEAKRIDNSHAYFSDMLFSHLSDEELEDLLTLVTKLGDHWEEMDDGEAIECEFDREERGHHKYHGPYGRMNRGRKNREEGEGIHDGYNEERGGHHNSPHHLHHFERENHGRRDSMGKHRHDHFQEDFEIGHENIENDRNNTNNNLREDLDYMKPCRQRNRERDRFMGPDGNYYEDFRNFGLRGEEEGRHGKHRDRNSMRGRHCSMNRQKNMRGRCNEERGMHSKGQGMGHNSCHQEAYNHRGNREGFRRHGSCEYSHSGYGEKRNRGYGKAYMVEGSRGR